MPCCRLFVLNLHLLSPYRRELNCSRIPPLPKGSMSRDWPGFCVWQCADCQNDERLSVSWEQCSVSRHHPGVTGKQMHWGRRGSAAEWHTPYLHHVLHPGGESHGQQGCIKIPLTLDRPPKSPPVMRDGDATRNAPAVGRERERVWKLCLLYQHSMRRDPGPGGCSLSALLAFVGPGV